MAKRSAKDLEHLDAYILEDNLKRDPHARAKKNQLIFSVLGLVMLVVGMGTMIFGVVEARKFTNNGNWPTVQGTITDTYVRTVSRRRAPDSYCINATYSYTVANRSYSNSWSTGDCSTNRAVALERAPSYLNGRAPIWYDPTNPGRAANQPIGAEFMYLIWGVGILIIIFAATCMSLSMKKPPPARKYKQPATPL
jgi:hypothetical protein